MRKTIICAAALALLMSAPHVSSHQSATPGVTKDTIKIGIHAPMTGAVPLPNESIQRAADLYWKWLEHEGETIHGRSVEVVLRDDDSNPTVAVEACRKLIRKDKVFMLSGMLEPQIVGSYQAQACARVADNRSVPYVSLGHVREGFDLDSYLATSETLLKQARAMAKVFIKELAAKGSKNAVVYKNSPFYSDTARVFEKALEGRGATLDLARDIPKTAGATHAEAVAAELSLMEIDNVLLIVTPTFAMQLFAAAENHGYHPNWSSVGFTNLLSDDTLGGMCSSNSSVDGMLATSPLPAFADRADYDPTYVEAIETIYPDAGGGDITTWLGWATAKQLHLLLKDAGKTPRRRGFLTAAQTGDRYSTGIIPSFRIAERDHFGGNKSYLLEASCTDDTWSTLRRI